MAKITQENKAVKTKKTTAPKAKVKAKSGKLTQRQIRAQKVALYKKLMVCKKIVNNHYDIKVVAKCFSTKTLGNKFLRMCKKIALKEYAGVTLISIPQIRPLVESIIK